jgi:hypothetical protein
MDQDPAPDPAIFVLDLKNYFKVFLLITYFLKVHLHHFSKIKNDIKKSPNSRNQGIFKYIFVIIEGSGSGSVPLTNGSGSKRP